MRLSTSQVFTFPEFPRVELVLAPYKNGFNYEWQYGDGASPCGGWHEGTLEDVRAFAVSRMHDLRAAAKALYPKMYAHAGG
jgi:hypothetical protein